MTSHETPEAQAARIAAQREALTGLGRALAPAGGRVMTLEAARHTSAYLELREGIVYFARLGQSRRADPAWLEVADQIRTQADQTRSSQ